MPVAEQAQQFIKAIGRDLEEVSFRWPDTGHDGAPAVKRRLHQLQVRVVGGRGKSKICLLIALAKLVVDDGYRREPRGPPLVAPGRIGHLETDFLVRLVVPNGEPGESRRVDGHG